LLPTVLNGMKIIPCPVVTIVDGENILTRKRCLFSARNFL
jgi:hypothetical protein